MLDVRFWVSVRPAVCDYRRSYDRVEKMNDEDKATLLMLLNEHDPVSDMLSPATAYLKGIVELKWTLAEWAVKNFLDETKRARNIREPKTPRELVGACNMLKRNASVWFDKELATQITDLMKTIERYRGKRNALAHGQLSAARSHANNLVIEDSSKSKTSPFFHILRGPLTIELEHKGVAVVLCDGDLRKMIEEIDSILARMLDVYLASDLDTICFNIRQEIKSDNPHIHFGDGRRVAEVNFTMSLKQLREIPATNFYECPECYAVGPKNFAEQCHGQTPRKVETKTCYVCNRTFAKDRLCEHLSTSMQYFGHSVPGTADE